MRRRAFIAALGGAAAFPFAARAQQAMPVIGFMHIASAGAVAHLVAAFRQGLKESGLADSQNIPMEFRWADGDYDQMPGFAADLASRRVAVIITGGGDKPAMAAKSATSVIPIVFNVGSNPVAAGLVASLGRPGGNVTGVNMLTTELATKRLSLLHDLLPQGVAIAHLVNPKFSSSEPIVRDTVAAARTMGRELVQLQASSESEIDAVFTALPQRQVGGLLVASDPFFYAHREKIVLWAVRLGIPAAYEQREYAVAGGLMSYSTSITDSYRQMGIYAGRILKGEKPANLPVVQSAKFELIVNLKTAKTLGLTLPSGLLAIVDEVIE
jgi:putative ABC transport system substrate-binding protein